MTKRKNRRQPRASFATSGTHLLRVLSSDVHTPQLCPAVSFDRITVASSQFTRRMRPRRLKGKGKRKRESGKLVSLELSDSFTEYSLTEGKESGAGNYVAKYCLSGRKVYTNCLRSRQKS